MSEKTGAVVDEVRPDGGVEPDQSVDVPRSRESMLEEVAEVIEIIRPALHADGGDIDLLDADPATGVVSVRLVGACGSCPSSTITLEAGVQRILKERVEGVTAVVSM